MATTIPTAPLGRPGSQASPAAPVAPVTPPVAPVTPPPVVQEAPVAPAASITYPEPPAAEEVLPPIPPPAPVREPVIRPVSPDSIPPITVVSRRNRKVDRSELVPSTMQKNKHYHWFRRDTSDLTSMRMKGYTPERADDPNGAKPLHDWERSSDGYIVMGDLLLASCPLELYESSRTELYDQNEAMIASTTAETENEAKAKGVKIIKDKE